MNTINSIAAEEERMKKGGNRQQSLRRDAQKEGRGTKTLGWPTSEKLGGLGGWGGLQVSRCPLRLPRPLASLRLIYNT